MNNKNKAEEYYKYFSKAEGNQHVLTPIKQEYSFKFR